MKRTACLLLAAAFLLGCTAPAVPEVQIDPRAASAEPTGAAAEPTGIPVESAMQEPVLLTEAPVSETPAQTDAPASERLSDRVIAAWTEAGYLSDMARSSELDLLDLYGIDLSRCISGAGYADAVGYTNEALVLEANGETAKELESLLDEHLKTMENQFRSYDPEALKIVESAILLREGGVVLMIVSPDAEEMLEAFRTVTP